MKPRQILRLLASRIPRRNHSEFEHPDARMKRIFECLNSTSFDRDPLPLDYEDCLWLCRHARDRGEEAGGLKAKADALARENELLRYQLWFGRWLVKRNRMPTHAGRTMTPRWPESELTKRNGR